METNSLRVLESPSGKYLVSTAKFQPGDFIAHLKGQLSLFRSRHSIETAYGHIEDPVFSYMNHSNACNVIVTRDGRVIAATYIYKGDEIVSNYLQHESCIEFPFTDAQSGFIMQPC